MALLADVRYAVRTLRKSPVFTAAAVLTMTLTIGATTAIFSVVNAVMIRPLPFGHPETLVQVAEKNDRLHLESFSASVLNYLSWKEQNRSFQDLGAISQASYALTGHGEAEQFQGAIITPSLIPLLGVQPIIGRNFREGEDRPGAPGVALISEALWRRKFGRDPAAIGAHMTLNGVDYTVIGVAPAGVPFLTTGDIWTPMTIDPGREIRLNHVIVVFGRLRPGVTLRQAQADMDQVFARVAAQFPEIKDWGIRLFDFRASVIPDSITTALLILFGAVGFVLLIACANVANLLLSRAASRQKEIAVRTALGASRGRMLAQLLTESLVLSATGGAIGLAAAVWSVQLMNSSLPPGLLPVPAIELDSTVLLFAVGVTLVTGLLFGFAPAWHAAATDLNTVLKQGSRSSIGGQRLMVRNGLVAGELALATVLLVGAGLLMQSLSHLQQVRLGFQPARMLTFQLATPLSRYPDNTKRWPFFRRVLESLNSIPGVTGAAMSSGMPLGAGFYNRSPFAPAGASILPDGASLPIDWRIVTPGYFKVMGISLLAGREFTEQDTPAAPGTVILSHSAAQKMWGSESAIGKAIHRPTLNTYFTVVGVVDDVRNDGLNQEYPALYFPSTNLGSRQMDVVLRTMGKPESVLSAVRARLHDLDPELPLSNVRTMDEWVSNNAAQPRVNATLLGTFAAVALLIAAIGVYGVLAYSVNQRTREIGLRMALGAQQAGVLRWIVGQGMVVALAGIAIGLVGAFALSRLLASLLFGIQPRDPLTFGAVAGVLCAVAFSACLVPAVRASRVDPIVALREE